MKSTSKKYRKEIQAQRANQLSKDNPSFQAMTGEPASDEETLYPPNPDTDAHNDEITTMFELVQRNQELKTRVQFLRDGTRKLEERVYVLEIRVTHREERIEELEDAIEQTLAHRGPDWASILRYALKGK